ncbi:MAG TPA: HAD hydrolase family protein, partial [Methanospirillum sp.]|nr:HAD hydrolase family protein [Methanospirillum sp.]
MITDIDGTLTDEKRRLSTAAIEVIRELQENGIMVVLASGNTSCLLKGLSKLIGTGGTFIGENGGVYRIGFRGPLKVMAEREIAVKALEMLV